jgi:putative membrane protein
MDFAALFITLHVTANLVWIGSITAVGLITASAAKAPNADAAGAIAQIALSLYRRVATPAFIVSFLFGAARLSQDVQGYMHHHWFHGKLTFALVVIVLHHIIGAKAKRVAAGSMQAGKSSAILTGALLACAFMTVAFVILLRSMG